MVVFSTTSAGFLWASRLPLITNELHAWMGTVPSKNKEGYDRWFQLLFLIFCYASPLLMVAILNLILACGRWFERITYRPTSPDDKQWEME